MNALDFLVGVSGPQLGNARAGLVASATSGPASAALGGLTSLLAVLTVAALTPSLRHRSPAITSAEPGRSPSQRGPAGLETER